MSGIAGVFHFDDRPIEPGTVERMTAEMAYRGPDGIAHWSSARAALGFCALHTTAESRSAAQPLVSDDGSLVAVFDGYLHNLDELRGALRERGSTFRTASDVEVALRAYQAWGEACPIRLEGEFALVVWDERKQAVFCARDHAGLKPLHYHWDGKRLVVASDPGAILVTPDVPQEPNLPMIAQVMANEWISRGETVWQGVMRLLPATWARFDRDGLRSETYWAPPREVSIRYGRDEEYSEHYREVFMDSVRQASRSDRPVAADVSGGLDSSAVFAGAVHLLRNDGLPAPAVKGYTYKFEPNSAPDELDYARAVAAHSAMEVREIEPFFADLEWFAERGREDRDMTPYPNSAMAVNIGKALVEDGCRALLNGEGGDEWLGGKPFYYAEQIAERDWRGLWRSFQEDRAAIGLRWPLYNLYRFGLAPYVPAPILAARRRYLLPKGPNEFDEAFWLTPEMDGLLKECRANVDRDSFMSIRNVPRRAMYMALKEPFCELSRDQFDRQCARLGYEPRTPMYARRFLEFAFATPERIRLRGNTRKFVHVQALHDLLPDAVRTRKTKADFSLAFERPLDKMHRVLVDRLPAEGRGFVSREGIRRLFDCYERWPVDDRPVWELWGMFACEAPRLARGSLTAHQEKDRD